MFSAIDLNVFASAQGDTGGLEICPCKFKCWCVADAHLLRHRLKNRWFVIDQAQTGSTSGQIIASFADRHAWLGLNRCLLIHMCRNRPGAGGDEASQQGRTMALVPSASTGSSHAATPAANRCSPANQPSTVDSLKCISSNETGLEAVQSREVAVRWPAGRDCAPPAGRVSTWRSYWKRLFWAGRLCPRPLRFLSGPRALARRQTVLFRCKCLISQKHPRS